MTIVHQKILSCFIYTELHLCADNHYVAIPDQALLIRHVSLNDCDVLNPAKKSGQQENKNKIDKFYFVPRSLI